MNSTSQHHFNRRQRQTRVFSFFQARHSPAITRSIPFQLNIQQLPSATQRSGNLHRTVPLFNLQFNLQYTLTVHIYSTERRSSPLFTSYSVVPMQVTFFRPFRTMLGPGSPMFIAAGTNRPLVTRQLAHPGGPHYLSTNPLEPPSTCQVHKDTTQTPIQLQRNSIAHNARRNFTVRNRTVTRSIFININVIFNDVVLIIVITILDQHNVLINIVLAILINVINVFDDITVIIDVIHVTNFTIVNYHTHVTVHRDVHTVFTNVIISVTILDQYDAVYECIDILDHQLPGHLPFLLLLLVQLFHLVTQLPLFQRHLQQLFQLQLQLRLQLHLFIQ